jgi:uncharacterized protein (TIGR00661 family)
MKCIFITQGEGRGHICQAIALKQILDKLNIQVLATYVGKNHVNRNHNWAFKELNLKPNYFYSPNFVYKNNEVNIPLTIFKTLKNLKNIKSSVAYLNNQIKHHNPDFIVNFYEPLTPLANHNTNIPVITIGHQFMINHPIYPNPIKWWFHKQLINIFNKLISFNSTHTIALSYYPATNHKNILIAPPLLRHSILTAKPKIIKNKVSSYLVNSQLIHTLIPQLQNYPNHNFTIYNESYSHSGSNYICKKISSSFIKDMLSSNYIVCSGGFETTAEANYHNKNILMVPLPNHTEQILNSLDATQNNIALTNNTYNLHNLLNNNITKIKNINKFSKKDYTQFYINFFKSLKSTL